MDDANVQELRDELARLMREHIDSMAKQTFLGITPDNCARKQSACNESAKCPPTFWRL